MYFWVTLGMKMCVYRKKTGGNTKKYNKVWHRLYSIDVIELCRNGNGIVSDFGPIGLKIEVRIKSKKVIPVDANVNLVKTNMWEPEVDPGL